MRIAGGQVVQPERREETDDAVWNAPRYFEQRLVFTGHLAGERVETATDPFDSAILERFLEIGPGNSGAHGIARAQNSTVLNQSQEAI